jgi:pyruvate kinase
MVAGVPIISPLMVNTIRVMFLGTVLARGANGGGKIRDLPASIVPGSGAEHRVTGRIIRAETLEEATASLRKKGGDILVVRNLDMSFVPVAVS